MTLKNRLERLEGRAGIVARVLSDDERITRVNRVLQDPDGAAAIIGAPAVQRVIELVEIARQRRAQHVQP
jgi:hypothetical protein